MNDNYCIYRKIETGEIVRIINHNKVEREKIIFEIENFNNNYSKFHDSKVELVTDEKVIEIIKFLTRNEPENDIDGSNKLYRLENAIEEITQIIARL